MCVALVLTALCARPCAAHEPAFDELVLLWDAQHAQLHGQLTWNPHRTPERDRLSAAALERRVLRSVEQSLRLELDGRVCAARYSLRELWVRAGATLGDSVLVRCPPKPAGTLRVFAGSAVNALAVSVQSLRPDGRVATYSTLVPGTSWSAPLRFGRPSSGWTPGGTRALGLPPTAASARPPPAAHGAPAAGASSPSTAATPASPAAPSWDSFLELGVRHILAGGWDHIAFVAALVLGAGADIRRLLWQLSAFTVAHSITLCLGVLGIVALPPSLIEPLIALSIAWMGVVNLVPPDRGLDGSLARPVAPWRPRERAGMLAVFRGLARTPRSQHPAPSTHAVPCVELRGRARAAQRARSSTVFAFGLLHGQGFAGALTQAGLPAHAWLSALFGFNLGVEVGQLCVVACLLLALRCFGDLRSRQRYAVAPGSVLVALAGLYWTVERLYWTVERLL